MDLTIIVGTFGPDSYRELADQRAIPSAEAQAQTVRYHHVGDGSYGQRLADCRNLPAAASTTEWLCFLDADDELMPGYVEAMSQVVGDLRTPAVSYVRSGRPTEPKFWPERDIRDGNWMIVSTLVRRELFLEVGGFRDVLMYEDWDLWQRCLIAGATIAKVPDAICRVHVRPESLHRHGSTRADKRAAHEQIRRLNYPELYEDAA